MAIVIRKNKILHIQWYDPIRKKTFSKSTRFVDNLVNSKKASRLADKLQAELNKQADLIRGHGFRDVTINDTIVHFMKVNSNKNPKTIKDYERFFKKFKESFDLNGSCLCITKLSIEDWLLSLRNLKLSNNSIHGYGKQCNHYLNFLFEYNYISPFKINRDVKTRPEIKEKIIFREDHLKMIMNDLRSKNSNFRITLLLLFYTGLRSSDILTITVERINFSEGTISYYSPKRKKYRTVPFHPCLKEFLLARTKEIKSGYVLQYARVENLGKAITRYFKELGLNDLGYTARTFRKTFVSLCRNKFNMDESVVKELVGHEHNNTTDLYYNHISLEVMKKELMKFKYEV